MQKLTLANCLISSLFPYKLHSLPTLTKRGLTVLMEQDEIRISNKVNDVVLVGRRDPTSHLFVLQEAPTNDATLLAKSYGGGSSSDQDLLWKLHLRHGHRNFADLAKQYQLPMPKTPPSCTSCVMGKAHMHHLSSGFERATRKAEGFHSDFRGPFSTPHLKAICICSPSSMTTLDAYLDSWPRPSLSGWTSGASSLCASKPRWASPTVFPGC